MNTVGIIAAMIGFVFIFGAYLVPVEVPVKGKQASSRPCHAELRELGILLAVVGSIILALPILGI